MKQGKSSIFAVFVQEMQRRKVFKVATVYAVVAWILLQLGEVTFEPLQLPQWALTVLVVTVILGFPVTVILAWTFDITEDGIVRTRAAGTGRGSAIKSLASVMVVLITVGALGYYLFGIYAPTFEQADIAPPELTDNSIAVLPFEDLSRDQDQGYFGDGIAIALGSLLNGIDGLKVKGQSSLLAYKNQEKSSTEIGQLLGVSTVLRGTVQKDQNSENVRITAQLIGVRDGFQLWSESYNRRLDDVLDVQEEIAREIVDQLKAEWKSQSDTPLVAANVAAPQSINVGALDKLFQGQEQLRRRTPDSLQRAIELLQDSINLDPTRPLAHAELASAYVLLSSYGSLPLPEAAAKAGESLDRALAYDHNLPEGFASLGLLRWNLGQLGSAESALRRAVRLDPNSVQARIWLAGLLGERGRHREEAVVLEQASEFDAINPLLNINWASNLLKTGEVQAGFEKLKYMLDVYPDSTLVLRTLADWHLAFGDFDLAHDFASQALAVDPADPLNRAMFAQILLRLGDYDGALDGLSADALESGNHKLRNTYYDYLLLSGDVGTIEEQVAGALSAEGSEGDPRDPRFLLYWGGLAALFDGRFDVASERLTDLLDLDTEADPTMNRLEIISLLARAYQGQQLTQRVAQLLDSARTLAEQVRNRGVAIPHLSYIEACLAALAGDGDGAMTKLRDAYSDGWRDAWLLENDVRLVTVRNHAEFSELSETVRSDIALARGQILDASLAANH